MRILGGRACTVDGCMTTVHAKGLCGPHYQRRRRHGSPTFTPTRPSGIDRLLDHVVVTPGPLDSDCWLSTYGQSSGGYVQAYIDGALVAAHRVTYEALVGPIPKGMQIDHLCRVRHCLNPAHLEPVTPRENVLRSNTFGARAIRDGVCKHGHSMRDAYVRRTEGTGEWRACRTCRQLRYARSRAA